MMSPVFFAASLLVLACGVLGGGHEHTMMVDTFKTLEKQPAMCFMGESTVTYEIEYEKDANNADTWLVVYDDDLFYGGATCEEKARMRNMEESRMLKEGLSGCVEKMEDGKTMVTCTDTISFGWISHAKHFAIARCGAMNEVAVHYHLSFTGETEWSSCEDTMVGASSSVGPQTSFLLLVSSLLLMVWCML